jgi:hypothetical protein
MATTADGIIYPVAGDYIAPLNAHIQALAESTQNAIDARVSSTTASYTPTFSGLTVGNGLVVAKYSKIGSIVVDEIEITFGTTTAMTGGLQVTNLPIASLSSNQSKSCGTVIFDDANGNDVLGTAISFSPNSLRIRTNTISGSVPILNFTTANSPFTWAAGDKIFISTVRLAA